MIYRDDGSQTFMADYFGTCYSEFEVTINSGSGWPTHNGDDGAALFENYTLIDSLTLNDSVLFSGSMPGDPYEDSWAYRNDDGSWNFAGEDKDQDDETYSVFTSGASTQFVQSQFQAAPTQQLSITIQMPMKTMALVPYLIFLYHYKVLWIFYGSVPSDQLNLFLGTQ